MNFSFECAKIINFKDSLEYFLTPANKLCIDENLLVQIVSVCNERQIYEFLFKKMLNGDHYQLNNAKGFLDWAIEGWNSNKYFVFFILNSVGRPIGCIDIKGNDTNASEIGFWLSETSSGIMTNAVLELCKQAQQNGFLELYADCLPNNMKSQKVINLCGFKEAGIFFEEENNYLRFKKNLNHFYHECKSDNIHN